MLRYIGLFITLHWGVISVDAANENNVIIEESMNLSAYVFAPFTYTYHFEIPC